VKSSGLTFEADMPVLDRPTRSLASLLTGAGFLLAAVSAGHAQVAPTPAELNAYSGLHAATAKGDIASIGAHVSAGHRVDMQDPHGRTPLMVAAYLGKHAVAQALLRLRANPNILDSQKYDVITIAAVRNDPEMLNLVLAAGGNASAITSPYEGTALIAAAHLGHDEIVKMLIAAGAPLDHVNNLGWTALLEAVILGNGGRDHTATLAALVQAGAKLNVADRQGLTPLAHARGKGYAEMVRILETAGAK
jgi:ankyrin repeat protein